jgi:hypothetical protein
MECNGDALRCVLLDHLHALPALYSQLRDVLFDLWRWLGPHIQNIAALASFAFGAWKWWNSRESVLYKRLQEMLAREDLRLKHARADVLRLISRPEPAAKAVTPLFSVAPLRRLLRRRRWRPLLKEIGIIGSVEREIRSALKTLDRQQDIALQQIGYFHEQRASVPLLQGAISAARAEYAPNDVIRRELDTGALASFRAAAEVNEQGFDPDAIEFTAHQLRKLGEYEQALDQYTMLRRHHHSAP